MSKKPFSVTLKTAKPSLISRKLEVNGHFLMSETMRQLRVWGHKNGKSKIAGEGKPQAKKSAMLRRTTLLLQ